MTGSEFKILREYLGITLLLAAQSLGVTQRQVQHVETENRKIPLQYARFIYEMQEKFNNDLDILIDNTPHLDKDTLLIIRYVNNDDLHLFGPEKLRYHPANYYNALVRSAILLMQLNQKKWKSVYFSRRSYQKWLYNREHSAELLYQWARTLIDYLAVENLHVL